MVWLLPFCSSETARCASTGDSLEHPPLLADFFSILLKNEQAVRYSADGLPDPSDHGVD